MKTKKFKIGNDTYTIKYSSTQANLFAPNSKTAFFVSTLDSGFDVEEYMDMFTCAAAKHYLNIPQ